MEEYTIENGTLTFNDNCKYIKEKQFKDNLSIVKIVIPGTCKKIDSNVFDGCKNLKEIILKDGVEEIDDLAFKGCHSVKKITFPKTLKHVSDNAFSVIFDTDPDSEGYGMILDDGMNVKEITFTGLKKDFIDVTNFKKIFIYNDMIIHCADGDIQYNSGNDKSDNEI